MTYNDPNLIVAALAAFFTFLAVVITYLVFHLQKRMAAKQKAVELHERYYHFENYGKICSPTWKISAKWFYLPESHRQAYRDAVAGGWIDYLYEEEVTTLQKWIPDFKLGINPEREHYRQRAKIEGLTEHETLSIFLKFWSDLYIYLEKGIVSKKLCSVFFDDYRHYQKFIMELRTTILQAHSHIPNYKPPKWILNTKKLELLFNEYS